MKPRKLFTYNAPVPAHIPSDLQDKLNETNGLWQFFLKPMDIPLFKSCLPELLESGAKESTLLWMPEEVSAEYKEFRINCILINEQPIRAQALMNHFFTGWQGDIYALVQRQQALV